MTGWSHRLERFSEALRQQAVEIGWTCSHPRCAQPAQYRLTYAYVTGRRGRVSHAERVLCGDHAFRTAVRRGLKIASASGVQP